MPEFEFPGGADAQLFSFTKFGSLNTKANRPAIKDEEFSYINNWVPLGDGNLRTLWAETGAIYSTGLTIIYTYPFNLGSQAYIAVFFSNGTAVQVNLNNGVTVAISNVANQFFDGHGLPQCSQWEAQFLVIVSPSTSGNGGNGYFLWDGTNLYGAGTLSPDAAITSAGEGYTSAPTVTIYGGAGSGATATATVTAGGVTKVTITNPGTGYLVTDNVYAAFSGGGSDTSARATANVVTTGGVSDVAITNSGTGYTTSSIVSFSGGGGSGAQAVITGLINGQITQITVTNPGTGYTSAPTIAVTVGSGFVGTVDVRYGQVSSITVTAGGSGYNDSPQVVIGPPDSLAGPTLQATAIAVVSGGGAVTSYIMTQEGLGYTKAPTVTIVGGNKAASATVDLMPFGIVGTTVETYQNSIWTASGSKVSFTAPGTTSNFSTAAGGGSFQSTDNFLRYQITALKQTNGFLYLLGDSSINVISNVQTNIANGVSTTTFNNSNVDPQTGTPWRDSVTVFGRAIVFANSSGVYALYGGAAEKVSGPLDGLFEQASFNIGGSGVTPVSAVATIFGIRCLFFLFTTLDPFLDQTVTLMAGWDGTRWFLATQLATMAFISTSEINSNLTAYGATATAIYPMFQAANAGLTKTFQTRLRNDPGISITKQVNRVYATTETPQGLLGVLDVSIDTEKGQGTQIPFNVSGSLVFVGSGPITFIGTGAITWTDNNPNALIAQGLNSAGEYGLYIGMTAQTMLADLTLVELAYLWRPYSPYA